MPRISSLISIAVHVIVIGGAILWSIVAPDTLPSPRSVLAFTDFTRITLPDIPLPPARRAQEKPIATAPDSAAPTEAPDRIAPEPTRSTAAGPSTGTGPDIPGPEIGLPGNVPGAVVTLAPPPPPQQPVRLHSGMQPPTKLVHVNPVYPTVAQATRVEGVVILEAIIDARGIVESVRVLRSIRLLDQAAIDAVKQWRFTPTRLNGEAVPIVMTVTVNFRLN